MSDVEERVADVPEEGTLRCDFCGAPSESVRRVALDGSYERLRTRHIAQYACRTCSERKERERAR